LSTFESFWTDLKNEHPELASHVENKPAVLEPLRTLWEERPVLRGNLPDLLQAYDIIAGALEKDGTLFICGNGGSFADALHISGELMKSYLRRRPLPEEHQKALQADPDGAELAEALERGLRVHVLGLNHSLASALENDIPVARVGYAQELYALGRPGDVLLGISTSGKAVNVRYAVAVARLLGMKTIGLTGEAGGPLAERVDLAVRVPERETRKVQELHQPFYHALCAMLEAHFFA